MKKYVVVYNTSETIPIIRHIITWETQETLEELKKWYYNYFTKLEGDELKVFKNMDEVNDFEQSLKKEDKIC
jgi:hypothetical protein